MRINRSLMETDISEWWWGIGIYKGREEFMKQEEEWIWMIHEYGEGIMANQRETQTERERERDQGFNPYITFHSGGL